MATRLPVSVVCLLLSAAPCFGQRLPANVTPQHYDAALSSFCDTSTLAEVKQFFASRKIPEAERTLQQSTERISACAALAAQQSGKLGAWLTNHQSRITNR